MSRRPQLSPPAKRSRVIIDVAPGMLRRWQREAKRQGWPLAQWMRMQCESGPWQLRMQCESGPWQPNPPLQPREHEPFTRERTIRGK